MQSLSDEQLAFLDRYGFDRELFSGWQQAVRDGVLSLQNNKVRSKLLAPESDQVQVFPKQGTDAREETRELGRRAIEDGELGVVVLNGGMATRFGGGVKGIVEVTGDLSFLGLKMRDVLGVQRDCGASIPVFVMNSFATHDATIEHFEQNDNFGLGSTQVEHFTQFVSVRMTPEGEVFRTAEGRISPYGPGHGDFAPALRRAGCLKRFLDGGGKYLFLSNVDNLGARISPTILGLHIQERAEVSVEVAPKWPGDVGGSPFLYQGKLQLVEQLRYPDDFDPEIVDVFNTNSFMFDAAALDRDFDLGWYYVEKTVEDQTAVQIERLVGEMTRFLRSNFIRVKRTGPESRFLPIKTPEDLSAAKEEIEAIYS